MTDGFLHGYHKWQIGQEQVIASLSEQDHRRSAVLVSTGETGKIVNIRPYNASSDEMP